MNGAEIAPVPAARVRIFALHRLRLFGDVLAEMVSGAKDIDLVGVSADIEALEKEAAEGQVDIALVEADLESNLAEGLVRRWSESYPQMKIVPVELDSDQRIVDFIEAGAAGYLKKNASWEDFLLTIRGVLVSRAPCSPRVAAAVAARMKELAGCQEEQGQQKKPPRLARLTPREYEVLGLVATGLQNKEIAVKLKITLPTVKNHVHKILEKFGVNRRREAIQLAYENGYLGDLQPFGDPMAVEEASRSVVAFEERRLMANARPKRI